MLLSPERTREHTRNPNVWPCTGWRRPAEQWYVLVTCRNEKEQVALLERLAAEGRECQALLS